MAVTDQATLVQYNKAQRRAARIKSPRFLVIDANGLVAVSPISQGQGGEAYPLNAAAFRLMSVIPRRTIIARWANND